MVKFTQNGMSIVHSAIMQIPIDVHFQNGVKLGELLQSEDGYYNFWPETGRGGYWPSYILREIADKVDEINKPWDEEIQNLTIPTDMV